MKEAIKALACIGIGIFIGAFSFLFEITRKVEAAADAKKALVECQKMEPADYKRVTEVFKGLICLDLKSRDIVKDCKAFDKINGIE